MEVHTSCQDRLCYPETTGGYHIASKTFSLHRPVDQSPSKFRSSHGTAVDANRELTATFWYPWQAKQIELPHVVDTSNFLSLDLTILFDEGLARPHVDEDNWRLLTNVQTNTNDLQTLEMVDGKHPLIIYSHGVGLNRTAGSIWCEELASQGFVVASIDHIGFMESKDNEHHGKDIHIERSKVLSMPMMEIRNIYFQDILYLLDQLFLCTGVSEKTAWEKLMTSVDTENIGIFGHSIGGGASWQVLWQDQRVKAAISMDGLLTNRVFSKVASYQRKPMLIMYPMRQTDGLEFHPTESGPGISNKDLKESFNMAAEVSVKNWLLSQAKLFPDHNTVNISIPCAGHYSFSDNILIKPFLIELNMEEDENSESEEVDVDENGEDKIKPPPPPTIEEVLGVGLKSLDTADFIRVTRKIVSKFFSRHLRENVQSNHDIGDEMEKDPVHPLTPPPPSGHLKQFTYLTVHPSMMSSINRSKDSNS